MAGQSSREIGRLLKGVIQKQVNQELTSTDIIDSENQTPVKISNSKDLALAGDMSQQATFNIATELATEHYMTFEPDGVDLRLWLKFQNAGTLVDYAKQNIKAYSVGENNLPGTFIHYNTDLNVKYEIFSYFNGKSHFAFTRDNPAIQLKNIVVDSGKNFALHMRMKPISLLQSLTTDNITIFSKIDDDQLRYGYAATMTPEGHMHFYIRKDYVQYHLFIKDAYSWLITDPQYALNNSFNRYNFNPQNYQTSYRYLCSIANSPDLSFEDWIFNYKPAGNQQYVVYNGGVTIADSASITEKPHIYLPLQDGQWNHISSTVENTTAYDSSGNTKNGTVSGNYMFTNDNEFYNPGSNVGGTAGGMEISFASNPTINTLTQFTIGICYNPDSAINTDSYGGRIVSKGVNVNNSFWIEHVSGTSKIKASIRTSSGSVTSVTSSTDLIQGEYNFILFRWKSGENLKLILNRDPEVYSTSTLSTTISNSSDTLKLASIIQSRPSKIAVFSMYTVQVTDDTALSIQLQGYHSPFFPKAESIQPVPDPDPLPITVPFAKRFDVNFVGTPIATDYRYINSIGGDNPYFQVYSCTDGVSVVDPIVQRYSVGTGSIIPGTPVTEMVSVPSSDNSSAILQKTSTTNEVVGVKITDDGNLPPPTPDTGSTVLEYTLTSETRTILPVQMKLPDGTWSQEIMFNFDSGASNPTDVPLDLLSAFGYGPDGVGTNSADRVTLTSSIRISGLAGEYSLPVMVEDKDHYDLFRSEPPPTRYPLIRIRDITDRISFVFGKFKTILRVGSEQPPEVVTATGTGNTLNLPDMAARAGTPTTGWQWVRVKFINPSNSSDNQTDWFGLNTGDFRMIMKKSLADDINLDLSPGRSSVNFDTTVNLEFIETTPTHAVLNNAIAEAREDTADFGRGGPARNFGGGLQVMNVYSLAIWGGVKRAFVPAQTGDTTTPPPGTGGGAVDQYGVRSTYGTGNWRGDFNLDYHADSDSLRLDFESVGANNFKSVELTAYVKSDDPADDELTGILGGGTHGDTPKCYNVGIDTLTGATRYRMEENHPDNITGESGPTGTPLKSTYQGYRWIKWNKPNGVLLEIWQDRGNNEGTTPANQWVKVASWIENDYNWQQPPSDHQESFRTDEVAIDQYQWKWVSIREILSTDTLNTLQQHPAPSSSVQKKLTFNSIPEPTASIGQTLAGRVIKKAKFWMQGGSSPTGTGYCRIWDENNNPVVTMGSFNSANLSTSTYQGVTFTNDSNTIPMKLGYTIGIEYNTGSTSDYIKLQRLGQNYDSTITQWTKKYNGIWGLNDAFEIKCELTYTYLTPDIDPYWTMGSTAVDIGALGEVFEAGSPMIGIVPTHFECRMYRDLAVAGGTVSLVHGSADGSVKAILKFISATTLPLTEPTDFNFVWENFNYNTPITAGDRLVILTENVGTNAIYVITSSGAPASENYDGTRSCLVYYDNTSGWASDNTLDLSGKMASGGNPFDAFERFSPTKVDIGEKIVNANSVLYNRRITRVVARGKKVGTPTGTITCGIMDIAFKTKVILGTFDVSTASSTSSYGDIIFSNPGNTYNTVEGDRIFFRYPSATSVNTIELCTGRDFVDGQDSIAFSVDAGTTTDIGNKDIAGRVYVGGDIDTNSRSRVVQSIELDTSGIKGLRITKAIMYLYRTTSATTGTAYCIVRRGVDDELVSTLGSVSVSTLSTNPSSPTTVTFTNTTNDYVMTVGDKVSLEFEGGNTTDHIGVLVVDIITTKYDFAFSYVRRYNGVEYVDPEPEVNIVMELYDGGYTYTPEANAPPAPTPVADKDLCFCAGRNKVSGFFEAIVVEARIYSKEITTALATNLYENKYTISPLGSNEILIPFTFKPSTIGSGV